VRTRDGLAAWAVAAALVLSSAATADDSGSKDELAAGEWEGRGQSTTVDVHEGGEPEAFDPLPTAPGTPTPGTSTEDGDDGEGAPPIPGDDGEDKRDIPTPSCPMSPPGEPVGPGPYPEPDDAGDGFEPADPFDPPDLDPDSPVAALPECPAKWAWLLDHPPANLEQTETLLTLMLFRTDAWGFVCNAYARSESTWYVDLFASTATSHSGRSQMTFRLVLEGGCGECSPEIRLVGISELEARAQVKAYWGGVDAGTTADAAAAAVWAGPLDGSDACSAQARPQSTGTTVGVAGFGMEAESSTSTSYSHAHAMGGKGASAVLKSGEVMQIVTDRTAVATDAGGTECNAQAKARSGFEMEIHARTTHGDLADLSVDLIEK
jgi:hypothetical protein